jgi:hypothetical protein
MNSCTQYILDKADTLSSSVLSTTLSEAPEAITHDRQRFLKDDFFVEAYDTSDDLQGQGYQDYCTTLVLFIAWMSPQELSDLLSCYKGNRVYFEY